MKHFCNSKFLLVCLLLLSHTGAKAQMVGTDAYIKGQYMEFGINGLGGYEGVDVLVSPIPVGMHMRSLSNLFGIVGNPQKNGWLDSLYDGDFFTPGSPENGWGIEIGTNPSPATGLIFGNNCTSLQQVNGAITSFATTGSYHTVIWEANSSAGDLHLKINYTMHDTALFYATTVSITNNSLATIPDLYYYKSFDPDNNQNLPPGDFTTKNTIVSQPSLLNPIAHVSATQDTPWESYIALIGLGENWRANYGGFSNRDASDLWTGDSTASGIFTQTVGAAIFLDEAIALAYRVQNLTVGSTETFCFNTVLDTSSIGVAIEGILFLDFVGEENNSSLIPDTINVCGPDSVQISVSGVGANNYTWEWSPSIGLSDTTGISVLAYPSTQTTYTVIGTPIIGTTAPDTMLIVVETFPSFSLVANVSSFGLVCTSSSPFVMTGGSPSGGIYGGVGVVNDTIYDPSIVSGGIYNIFYTVSDSTGCSSIDTATIIVNDVIVTQTFFATYCNSVTPFVLTGGSPSGGVYSGTGVVTDSIYNPAFLSGVYPITYTFTDSLGCSGSIIENIQILDCTGIETNELNDNVIVYPVPFSDFTLIKIDNSVQLQEAKIHIYDVLGKEVVTLSEITEHEFKIERNNLESGIYFYKLENNKKIIASGKLLIN